MKGAKLMSKSHETLFLLWRDLYKHDCLLVCVSFSSPLFKPDKTLLHFFIGTKAIKCQKAVSVMKREPRKKTNLT